MSKANDLFVDIPDNHAGYAVPLLQYTIELEAIIIDATQSLLEIKQHSKLIKSETINNISIFAINNIRQLRGAK